MTTTEQQAVRAEPARLKEFVAAAYRAAGLAEADAAVAAEAMVRTDERGQHTHGIWYLHQYLPQIRNGVINPSARPRVVRETPATALLDGDAGLGAVVASAAAELAVRKARDVGFATVLVRNSNHFGAAGYFTLRIAEQGLVGLMAAGAGSGVAAPGSATGVIGTQPISYCVPDPDGQGPVMLDMALSTVAGTKVLQAVARGDSVPEGWIVDSEGRPTTDPARWRDGGALLPVGGHKGYGLGILVEVMSAVLSGAGVTKQLTANYQAGRPLDVGHWVAAFDVEAFMARDEFARRLAALREEIHAAPTAPGVDSLMLPGEPEARHAAETAAGGLEVEGYIWQTLVDVADELGLRDELGRAAR